MNDISIQRFEVPDANNKVLMHSCCAPCSGPLMEKMVESSINLTIFFIIPIFIPKKNMKFAKMKVYALLKN